MGAGMYIISFPFILSLRCIGNSGSTAGPQPAGDTGVTVLYKFGHRLQTNFDRNAFLYHASTVLSSHQSLYILYPA